MSCKPGSGGRGIFYAFMVFLHKVGLALGLFFVGQALDWAGFVPSVAEEALPIQPDRLCWPSALPSAPYREWL